MTAPLIFITGATGFIGSQTVVSTLQAGYRVRLSIRKPEQEADIRALHAAHTHNIETTIVTDMTKKESFMSALHGVDYIFHLASPMPGSGADVQRDYIDPAVQTTESVLYAAKEFPQIKKVIVMSSVLALAPVDTLGSAVVSVTDNTGEPITVNPSTYPYPPSFRGHGLKYATSKILAHASTRTFLSTQTPHYVLLTLHPVFVLGENLLQHTPAEIHGMNKLLWASLNSPKPQIANAWVHVRDVADAHVRAVQNESIPTGTEFLLAAPAVDWEEVAGLVRREFPGVGCKLEGPFEGGWVVDCGGITDKELSSKWDNFALSGKQ
ncbi:dihydroflavonal-4-reductase [Aspergillus ellipticus CBS 707.79]|uniref:Dihydroflavonal-4-reductase n=1 Tax=Aspergillus ellipticus CBS 707.79 TaxID=1448320 RepID=A0A319D3S8_9EURO|nr:dihydroflavonal-4-reductase [Aspergillus ellipticus CBS 707.79]